MHGTANRTMHLARGSSSSPSISGNGGDIGSGGSSGGGGSGGARGEVPI